jgi:hypothetical protein
VNKVLKVLANKYFWLAVFSAISIVDFAQGDELGGFLFLALGVVFFSFDLWSERRDRQRRAEAAIPKLRSALQGRSGMRPTPEEADPGRPDPDWFAVHAAESPNCPICRSMGWIE